MQLVSLIVAALAGTAAAGNTYSGTGNDAGAAAGAAIVGGMNNAISDRAVNAIVLGGQDNDIGGGSVATGTNSVVAGGKNNHAIGDHAAIGGGSYNYAVSK
jgi:hypothetical protein